MEKHHAHFCIYPFILVNTRGNGEFRVCSEDLPKYSHVENFHHSKSIEKVWNCDFYKNLRMELIANKPQKMCDACYYHDRIGVKSKRVLGLELFYDKYIEVVRDAARNHGRVSSSPKWWELRLSSRCNLACRMCGPSNSSRFSNELNSYSGGLPSFVREQMSSAAQSHSLYGDLSDSEEFMAQLLERVSECDYIEIHGGEPFIDKQLWNFLAQVSSTAHAKRIKIYSHCNLTNVSDQQIEILNSFAGGRANVSIDAYKEENEFIRWNSKWQSTTENLPKFGRLHNGFSVCIGTTVSVYQACSIDSLFVWIDQFLLENPKMRLVWLVWPVVRPEFLRVDLLPKDLRMEAIERLRTIAARSFACTDYTYAKGIKLGVDTFTTLLSNDNPTTESQIEKFVQYTQALDRVRNQDSFKMFPHLESVLARFSNLKGREV